MFLLFVNGWLVFEANNPHAALAAWAAKRELFANVVVLHNGEPVNPANL